MKNITLEQLQEKSNEIKTLNKKIKDTKKKYKSRNQSQYDVLDLNGLIETMAKFCSFQNKSMAEVFDDLKILGDSKVSLKSAENEYDMMKHVLGLR